MVLEDNQKIGIGLICLGLGFLGLGVLLFFDPALTAIGNALFLAGLFFAIGVKRTFALFSRSDRIRGTICFFLGIFLVVYMKWGLFGMFLEGFGFLNLFGNFLPTVLTVGRQIPYVGKFLDLPVVAQAVDFLVGKTRPKYYV